MQEELRSDIGTRASADLLSFCKLPSHYSMQYVSSDRHTEYVARQGGLPHSVTSNIVYRDI